MECEGRIAPQLIDVLFILLIFEYYTYISSVSDMQQQTNYENQCWRKQLTTAKNFGIRKANGLSKQHKGINDSKLTKTESSRRLTLTLTSICLTLQSAPQNSGIGSAQLYLSTWLPFLLFFIHLCNLDFHLASFSFCLKDFL